MRSPPEVPIMFALESAMDEMAEKVGIDPVEFRRVNDTDKDWVSGKPYSSRNLMKCYDEAARAFGWSKRDAKPGAMRDGDWLIGHGCATACYPTQMGSCVARVTLFANGRARVDCAAHDVGQGVKTVIGQFAAEFLGLPGGAVEVHIGDSSLPPRPDRGRFDLDGKRGIGGQARVRQDPRSHRQCAERHARRNAAPPSPGWA